MPAATKDKDSATLARMQTPEEFRVASEKLMNFWVGAATPLWLPFMAATSFGIGTWALTQAMQRQQSLLKDMPIGGGFGGALENFWLASERASEAMAVTGVRLAKEAAAVEPELKSHAETTAEALSNPSAAVSKAATAIMNESIELASKTIESVTAAVQTAAKPAKDAVKAAVEVEPAKVEIPKVELPKVEPVKVKPAKLASPVATAKAAVKTADKVAEALSDTPKPSSRRRPARKA